MKRLNIIAIISMDNIILIVIEILKKVIRFILFKFNIKHRNNDISRYFPYNANLDLQYHIY